MEGQIVIRSYQESDYEDVSRIFSRGMAEAVVPLRRQLFTFSNHIQRPMQLISFALGYFLTGRLVFGALALAIYCLLAIASFYLAQHEYLRCDKVIPFHILYV